MTKNISFGISDFNKIRNGGRRELEVDEDSKTINGLWIAGALGKQLTGTWVQRFERRPVWSVLGFDPNLPVQR